MAQLEFLYQRKLMSISGGRFAVVPKLFSAFGRWDDQRCVCLLDRRCDKFISRTHSAVSLAHIETIGSRNALPCFVNVVPCGTDHRRAQQVAHFCSEGPLVRVVVEFISILLNLKFLSRNLWVRQMKCRHQALTRTLTTVRSMFLMGAIRSANRSDGSILSTS